MAILQRIGTFVKFSGEKSERVINMKMHCCKCIVGNNLKDCLEPLNSQNMQSRYAMVTKKEILGF